MKLLGIVPFTPEKENEIIQAKAAAKAKPKVQNG